MKFVNIANNFSSGEWSPKMHSRVDTEQYRNSCEEITNFIVQMQGGAKFRAGTVKIPTNAFDEDVIDSISDNIEVANNIQLVPYSPVNKTKQGILFCIGQDLTHTVWGFYKPEDGSCVEVTQISGVYGQFTSYSLVGVTNSWDYVQVGDFLILTNKLGECTPLVFFYDTVSAQYVLQSFDNQNLLEPWKAHPYSPIYALSKNVTMSIPAITNTVGSTFTLTSSAAYFKSSDVGRWVRLTNGSNAGGWVKIEAYLTSTTVTVRIHSVLHTSSAFIFGSTTNSASFWQISEWGEANWPRTVTAFQGRVIFGGSSKYPDTIWGSRISNFWDFMEVPPADATGIDAFSSGAYTGNNSRPFTLTPNSPEPSVIKALSSAKTLMIHTEKAEIVAYGSNGALGPNNVQFESSTSFGSSSVRPVRVNNFSTFVQGNGKLRDIIYAFNEDQYKSSDLSFVSDHLFVNRDITGIGAINNKIVELTKFEGESSLLLARLSNGKVKYVTLDRDYQVNAWGSIDFGHNGAGATVLSMASLDVQGVPTVYIAMRRVISGVSYFSFEKLKDAENYRDPLAFTSVPLVEGITLDNYLDCTEYLTGTDQDVNGRATTFTFADPSLSETLHFIADGNYIGEHPVVDGEIVFATRYKQVTAGYLYTGVLTTNGVEAGGNFGPPLGQIKRIDKAVIRFLNTGNAQYGISGEHLFTIPMRENGKGYFTGDKQLEFPAGYFKKATVTVKQDKPYPCYIISIAMRGLTND